MIIKSIIMDSQTKQELIHAFSKVVNVSLDMKRLSIYDQWMHHCLKYLQNEKEYEIFGIKDKVFPVNAEELKKQTTQVIRMYQDKIDNLKLIEEYLNGQC